MRAVAVEPARHVAVMAEHPQTLWPTELAELVVERRSRPSIELPPMRISATINVVNGQELLSRFATAGAAPTVVSQCLSPYPLVLITVMGIVLFLARRAVDALWLGGPVAGSALPRLFSSFVARLRLRPAFGASRAIGGIVRLLACDAAPLLLMLLIALAVVLGSSRFHSNLIIPRKGAKIND